MCNKTKVSIITVVHNGEKYIEKAIKSIISQNYTHIEYIIIDGDSTDSTMDIINKYKNDIHIVVSEKDKGMYDALNKGFSLATGDVLCWLNSDDYLFPNAINTVVDVFNTFPQVEWLTGRKVIINKHDQIIKIGCFKSFVKKYIHSGYYRGDAIGFITQEATFWKKGLYEKAGSFVDSNYKLASDFELWTRFSNYTELYSINTLLGAFRLHGDQLSRNKADYYLECDKIKPISRIRIKYLNILRSFFYVFGIVYFKNKIQISSDGVPNMKKRWFQVE